jgi:hypothetical protein
MEHDNLRDEAESKFSALFLLPRRPRALILTVFALALLFALIAPLAQLLRASMTPLDAQACVWPRAPLVGQPMRIVITLSTESDRAASAWTRVAAEWDMVSMRMGVRQAITAPSSAERAVTIPLMLDMAGAWAAHVLIQAPGRPNWTANLTFSVFSVGQAIGAPTPTAVAGCVEPSERADRSTGGAP